MATSNNTAYSFKGQDLYIGIDVHKKQWTISVMTKHVNCGRPLSINPSPVALSGYLKKHYPDGIYHVVYEAGFSGFWAARELIELGINCIVVHPPDIPTSQKEKVNKTDPIDSKKLARSLRNGDLKPIYIPDKRIEEYRFLNRHRRNLAKDRQRTKARIKGKLNYFGIEIPLEYQGRNWSGAFIKWLSAIKFETEYGKYAMDDLISQLLDIRKRVADTLRKMKELAKSDPFNKIIPWILKVPGVGLTLAMTLVTEIVDMARFPNFKDLVSFVGLAPAIQSSGETETVSGITCRRHKLMRSMLIEASWIAIRVDPALTAKHGRLAKRMSTNKAIVRIAKSLLSRIRYVWINQKPYVMGVVQ